MSSQNISSTSTIPSLILPGSYIEKRPKFLRKPWIRQGGTVVATATDTAVPSEDIALPFVEGTSIQSATTTTNSQASESTDDDHNGRSVDNIEQNPNEASASSEGAPSLVKNSIVPAVTVPAPEISVQDPDSKPARNSENVILSSLVSATTYNTGVEAPDPSTVNNEASFSKTPTSPTKVVSTSSPGKRTRDEDNADKENDVQVKRPKKKWGRPLVPTEPTRRSGRRTKRQRSPTA